LFLLTIDFGFCVVLTTLSARAVGASVTLSVLTVVVYFGFIVAATPAVVGFVVGFVVCGFCVVVVVVVAALVVGTFVVSTGVLAFAVVGRCVVFGVCVL
jgi:hypothetical protein